MVVGVHRIPRAHLAAEYLDCSIGYNLVGVHVRGSTGPRLKNVDDEMVVKIAVDNLLGGLHDGICPFLAQQSQFLIHLRRRSFDHSQRTNKRPGESEVADRKVLHRPHRAGPVISAGGNIEFAHGIAFFSEVLLLNHVRAPDVVLI